MKKIMIGMFVLLLAVSVYADSIFGTFMVRVEYPKTDIQVSIVTNKISPELKALQKAGLLVYITNAINCVITNSFYIGDYYNDKLVEENCRLSYELGKAQAKISELTFPKNYSDSEWVWSNTVYTVSESPDKSVSWTNEVCIFKRTTKTDIIQLISTNVDVIVEEIK